MGTVTTLPTGQAFTRRDLERMPDDGRRHELVDGVLLVTPAPSPRHQTAVLALGALLRAHCPADLQVLIAPLDVVLDDDTVLQPDVLVAPRSSFSARDLPEAPLLAVEVLSPATRRVDMTLKRARYLAACCPSYWVVDPDEPSVTVWQLDGEEYVERAHVLGEETATVTAPFEVTVTAAELLR